MVDRKRMETKKINGKKYIEYNEYKSLRNKTIINSIFLVLMFMAVIGLFMAITTIIKNKEMLQSEPIDYVMDKYDFVSCSCTDKEGEIFQSGFNVIEVTEVIG